jgi:hypothetical protein
MKQELQILKKLKFREIGTLFYCFCDIKKGNLFIKYDLHTLNRKSFAQDLEGNAMRKEDFEQYMLFKMGLKRLEAKNE